MTDFPISDIVNVDVVIQPEVTGTLQFGSMLIIGSTAVIPDNELMRVYHSIEGVGKDFGMQDPEYQAAAIFFSQTPQPTSLYIAHVRKNEQPADVIKRSLQTTNWYGCALVIPSVNNNQIIDCAKIIEASGNRTFWVTTQDPATLTPTVDTDLASLLSKANYARTVIQYSSNSAYAAVSLFARIATVDYTANNTTITLKFKQEPGVTAETLNGGETARQALDDKHCNVYLFYQGNTAIIQQGVMCNGNFIDETIGLDVFKNTLQLAVFNLLYGSSTKVPQTDGGSNLIQAVLERACQQFVTNGFFYTGAIWEGQTIGALKNGDTMNSGYYIYMPPISGQSKEDRKARKAVTAQIACRLAGAVHFANVIVNVTR